MKSKTLVLLSAVLIVLCFFISLDFQLSGIAEASTFSAWASIEPTIDGIVSEGEWDDADSLTFSLTTLGDLHEVTLYVKNDNSNLYIAIILRNDDYSPKDNIDIGFDDNNNGLIENGEDMVYVCNGWQRNYDGFAEIMPTQITWRTDISDGGTDDLVAATTHTNPTGIGDYTFELFHPLNTADDAHDFSLFPGDIVGFGVQYGDATDHVWYADFYPRGFPRNFAKIIIAHAPTPKTIYVDDDNTDGPWDGTPEHPYQYIQDGINAASPGDTIIVHSGAYIENIDVNKDHLTIGSEGGVEATIVQAANSDDHVFEVTTDYVTINGFTVKGATATSLSTGIYLNDVQHCDISNNNVTNNGKGIYLLDSSNIATTGMGMELGILLTA